VSRLRKQDDEWIKDVHLHTHKLPMCPARKVVIVKKNSLPSACKDFFGVPYVFTNAFVYTYRTAISPAP
jgi:hypothetical protein